MTKGDINKLETIKNNVQKSIFKLMDVSDNDWKIQKAQKLLQEAFELLEEV